MPSSGSSSLFTPFVENIDERHDRAVGNKFAAKMTAQVLRAVFSLKNLRRAPGPTGKLGRHVMLQLHLAVYH